MAAGGEQRGGREQEILLMRACWGVTTGPSSRRQACVFLGRSGGCDGRHISPYIPCSPCLPRIPPSGRSGLLCNPTMHPGELASCDIPPCNPSTQKAVPSQQGTTTQTSLGNTTTQIPVMRNINTQPNQAKRRLAPCHNAGHQHAEQNHAHTIMQDRAMRTPSCTHHHERQSHAEQRRYAPPPCNEYVKDARPSWSAIPIDI
eukprot:364680-Chlamydomonas_euryale.AAC.1